MSLIIEPNTFDECMEFLFQFSSDVIIRCDTMIFLQNRNGPPAYISTMNVKLDISSIHCIEIEGSFKYFNMYNITPSRLIKSFRIDKFVSTHITDLTDLFEMAAEIDDETMIYLPNLNGYSYAFTDENRVRFEKKLNKITE